MRECFRLSLHPGLHFCLETERLVSQTTLDNFFQSDEGATANEKNVRRVDGKEFLVRMFASALRRHVCNCSFQNFQQRLLHAFAGDIASD